MSIPRVERTPPSALPSSRIPDVATLREICHGVKLSRDSRAWYVLQRRISIYLTWLLLHTPLTPNQVTWISVLLTVAGSVLLAFPSSALAVGGAVCLLLHHLLDKVDGDIARFRRVHSIVGVYLDELGHGVAFAGLFLGLGLHLAWSAPAWPTPLVALLVGSLGALAMVLGRQHKSIGFLLYAQHAMDRPELLPAGGSAKGWNALARSSTHRARGGERGSAPRPVERLRDLVLQMSDFSLMLLLVLVGTVVEAATGSTALLWAMLIGEAALQGLVFLALVAVNVKVNVASEVARLHARDRDRGESRP